MSKVVYQYKYPCTKNIGITGFGDFLEKEAGTPRRNLGLFAREFAQLISAPGDDISKQLVLVNSGSSANLVAALAMADRCRREGRPLTAAVSAFTFPTTISALLIAGFSVRLVDVAENHFNLSVESLCKGKDAPSLVAVTHFLGFPADMPALLEYQKATGCLILQDACETLAARLGDTPLYKFGDMITWSFYHPHHLSSYGGGAVYSASMDDYLMADSITHWGRACKCHIDKQLCHAPAGPAHQFTYDNVGVNVEMSELNACFGRWQLRCWPEIEARRQAHYKTLYSMLAGREDVMVWPFFNERQDSPFVFPILSKRLTVYDVYNKLLPDGIEIRTLMGGSATRQKAFKDKVSYDDCPNASYMTEHSFFVGCHHTLSNKDVTYVGKKLCEIL